MASPKIKFKRSAVASKRPSLASLELGELALNTYDGKLFTRRDTSGVGIATTVSTINPWTENYGSSAIEYDGNIKVAGVSTFSGTTNHTFTNITRSDNGIVLQLRNTSTANNAHVDQRFVIDGASRAGIRGQINGANVGGKLRFYTADDTQTLTERAVIDQNGRFGINVTSPTRTLDVGGTTQTEKLNVTGVATASQFSGFSHLIAPFGSTTTINVTVASKTSAHRYNGTGSGSGYVLDDVESPFLTLTPGRTYRFVLSSSDMSSHPFRFYLDAAKNTAYTTNVTSTSTYTEIEVTDSTPTILHYQCSSHGYMGNAVQVSSSNAIQLNSQAASYYLDYDNFSNTPTIPTNNNQLTNGAGYITTSFTNTNQLTNGAGFITASDDITGNAATATQLETSRNIGGVSFNGTADINLPGVNQSGTQDTSGNAATATKLETARNIAGVSFDGTSNISLNNNAITNGAGYITNNVSGNLTATSFIGNGSALTGIVTTLVAGDNISLSGSTGTVTITGSASTDRINAESIVVSGVATFLGNVTIGGTLTYEDVTDIDSVGIITANQGVNITGGGLKVVGVSTFQNVIPQTDSTYDIGTNTVRFRNVYADTYYGDGSQLTGISAGAGGTENVSSNTTISGIITASDQFYPPTLTTSERDALTVTQGALIFNTTENKVQMYLGSEWKSLAFELDTYTAVGL